VALTRIPDPNRPMTWGPHPNPNANPNANRPTTGVLTLTDPRRAVAYT